MTEPCGADRVKANAERSRDSLEAATELRDNGHYDAAASRAYYAAFYAATAVLLTKGLEFSRHAGLLAAVHRELVRPGLLARASGRALDRLFRLRLVGDYGSVVRVPAETAREAVELAGKFVEESLALLSPHQAEQG